MSFDSGDPHALSFTPSLRWAGTHRSPCPGCLTTRGLARGPAELPTAASAAPSACRRDLGRSRRRVGIRLAPCIKTFPSACDFGGRRVYRGWRIAHSRPWHHGGHPPAPRPTTAYRQPGRVTQHSCGFTGAWRDRDSNRGHHDFQAYRDTPQNPSICRAFVPSHTSPISFLSGSLPGVLDNGWGSLSKPGGPFYPWRGGSEARRRGEPHPDSRPLKRSAIESD